MADIEEGESFSVTLLPSGSRFTAHIAEPILRAALRAGLRLPSACRNGTCRACICRAVDGRVTYQIEWPGLSAEEKREGLVLPCVAHAASDVMLEQTLRAD